MVKQIEASRSVNRGVGVSNVADGGISRSRMTINSEIPSVYWEGRNVTPQSLTKLVRIEEEQKSMVESDHKSQERKRSGVILPSYDVGSPMSEGNVQEQRVTPINSPGNSRNNTHGGTVTETGKETLLTELNVNDGSTQFILTDTRTVTLLNLRSSVVAKDSKQYENIVLQGREYEKLKAAKLGNGGFTSRSTQTPIIIQKDKEVMVMAVSKNDMACGSSTWDMLELTKCLNDDDIAGNHGGDSSKVSGDGQLQDGAFYPPMHNKWPQYGGPSKQSDDLIAMALADTPGCFLDVSGTYAPPPVPQYSGYARHTSRRSNYYPNIGERDSRRRSALNRPNRGGGRSSASVSRSSHRPVGADNNNNTSFSLDSYPTGMDASITASTSASTLSAMQGCPIRNELSLEEVVKRLSEKQNKSIMESPELLSALQMVERCMASRLFHQEQLLYCSSPPLDSATAIRSGEDAVSDIRNVVSSSITTVRVNMEDGKSKQRCSSSVLGSVELPSPNGYNGDEVRRRLSLKKLWVHRYPFCSQWGGSTKETMSVTSLAFSPEPKCGGDIIASGYSIRALQSGGIRFVSAMKEGGKVLFWSLRNPNSLKVP